MRDKRLRSYSDHHGSRSDAERQMREKIDWAIVIVITIVLVAAQIGLAVYVRCVKLAIETGGKCL